MKRSFLSNLFLFSLLLVSPRPARRPAPVLDLPPAGFSIQLAVPPLQQSKITSCGPAALAMAYNYAFPLEPIRERDILTYAEKQGWYTETKYPYTSPANMTNLLRHYTRAVATGAVTTSEQGLALLAGELEQGHPVIIDALTVLGDLRSGAHFVLVTGLSVAPDNKYAVIIHYNDPLTGKTKSAPWYGEGGLWEAWRRNSDPGGQGWWLVIRVLFDWRDLFRERGYLPL